MTLPDAVAIPVIAAGGLASVEDILRLKARPGAPVAATSVVSAFVQSDTDTDTPQPAACASLRSMPHLPGCL